MLSLVRSAAACRTPSSLLRPRLVVLECLAASEAHHQVRFFSDANSPPPSDGQMPFRPRRRPSKTYRPLKPRYVRKKGPIDPHTMEKPQDRTIVLGANEDDSDDKLEADFGPLAADAIRHTWKERTERGGEPLSVEQQLRMIDYMTSETGSMEDLVGERRALALDAWDEKDRTTFMKSLEEFIEEERIQQMDLEGISRGEEEGEDKAAVSEHRLASKEAEEELAESGDLPDPNQLAFGEWGECVVRVDRVQKVQKGGTMVRYRSLVIGGNANGCAGFGIGKANSPKESTEIASRMCRRNIFFVDRYQGSGLTRDLAGRHNSCKVILLAVQPTRGLRGHPLVCDIMQFFGISDCSSKTHGNRNIYNVVRATFKAILTHESMEEIALKRGKRLLNLERAKRLQI